MPRPRVILFNPHHGGHHPQHLECLIHEWGRSDREGSLHVVISETAARQHPQVARAADAVPGVTLHQAPTPRAFERGGEGLLVRERVNRDLGRMYAERLRADHLAYMSLDGVQFALALDLRFSWPLAVSGIYFRPSFHYGALGIELTIREKMVSLAKQVVIRAALRNPHLRTIFTLDGYAADVLQRWTEDTACVFLPEPLWSPSAGTSPPELVSRVEPGRRRLVAFGVLDETRKGIPQVLEALRSLPTSSQRELALILAGPLVESERDALLARLRAFEATSSVQLLVTDGAVPEAQIQPLLGACDLGLVTYLRHVGSSGVLLRAAAAGLPVLASEYGLVGLTVREHRLGATVDTRSPESIRNVVSAWLDDPGAIGFDPAGAAAFARENTAEAFATTFFSHLLERRDPDGRAPGDGEPQR